MAPPPPPPPPPLLLSPAPKPPALSPSGSFQDKTKQAVKKAKGTTSLPLKITTASVETTDFSSAVKHAQLRLKRVDTELRGENKHKQGRNHSPSEGIYGSISLSLAKRQAVMLDSDSDYDQKNNSDQEGWSDDEKYIVKKKTTSSNTGISKVHTTSSKHPPVIPPKPSKPKRWTSRTAPGTHSTEDMPVGTIKNKLASDKEKGSGPVASTSEPNMVLKPSAAQPAPLTAPHTVQSSTSDESAIEILPSKESSNISKNQHTTSPIVKMSPPEVQVMASPKEQVSVEPSKQDPSKGPNIILTGTTTATESASASTVKAVTAPVINPSQEEMSTDIKKQSPVNYSSSKNLSSDIAERMEVLTKAGGVSSLSAPTFPTITTTEATPLALSSTSIISTTVTEPLKKDNSTETQAITENKEADTKIILSAKHSMPAENSTAACTEKVRAPSSFSSFFGGRKKNAAVHSKSTSHINTNLTTQDSTSPVIRNIKETNLTLDDYLKKESLNSNKLDIVMNKGRSKSSEVNPSIWEETKETSKGEKSILHGRIGRLRRGSKGKDEEEEKGHASGTKTKAELKMERRTLSGAYLSLKREFSTGHSKNDYNVSDSILGTNSKLTSNSTNPSGGSVSNTLATRLSFADSTSYTGSMDSEVYIPPNIIVNKSLAKWCTSELMEKKLIAVGVLHHSTLFPPSKKASEKLKTLLSFQSKIVFELQRKYLSIDANIIKNGEMEFIKLQKDLNKDAYAHLKPLKKDQLARKRAAKNDMMAASIVFMEAQFATEIAKCWEEILPTHKNKVDALEKRVFNDRLNELEKIYTELQNQEKEILEKWLTFEMECCEKYDHEAREKLKKAQVDEIHHMEKRHHKQKKKMGRTSENELVGKIEYTNQCLQELKELEDKHAHDMTALGTDCTQRKNQLILEHGILREKVLDFYKGRIRYAHSLQASDNSSAPTSFISANSVSQTDLAQGGGQAPSTSVT